MHTYALILRLTNPERCRQSGYSPDRYVPAVLAHETAWSAVCRNMTSALFKAGKKTRREAKVKERTAAETKKGAMTTRNAFDLILQIRGEPCWPRASDQRIKSRWVEMGNLY